MKKFFILFLISFFSVATNAQHLTFMKIPLDGNIENFTNKLAQKNIFFDKKLSKELGKGMRAFNGTFFNEESSIVVFYTPKTKKVFAAKAVLDKYDKNKAILLYYDIKDALLDKYECKPEYEEINGFPSTVLYVFDKENNNDILGAIGVYIKEKEIPFMYNNYYYSVHVEYQDYKNYLKEEESKKDDL